MPFYLKISQEHLRQTAERLGLQGDNWRELILEDLLHDGEFELAQTRNADGPVFELYGRLVTLRTAQDRFRSDTLFVISMNAGPARGNRLPPYARRVSGPWLVLPSFAPNSRGYTVSEHVAAFFKGGEPSTAPGVPGASGKVVFGAMAHALSRSFRGAGHEGHRVVAPRGPLESTAAGVAVSEVAPSIFEDLTSGEAPVSPESSMASAEPLSEAPSGPDSTRPVRKVALSWVPSALQEIAMAQTPREALEAKRAEYTQELERLQDRLRALPSEADLGAVFDLVERISALADTLGLELPAEGHRPPQDLARTVLLLEAMTTEQWLALPEWVTPRGQDRVRLIYDDTAAAEVEEVLAWMRAQFGDQVPAALAELTPGHGERLLGKVRAAWEAHDARVNLSNRLAPLPIFPALLNASDAELRGLLTRVEALQGRLHPDALAQLWAEVGSLGAEAWLERSEGVLRTTLPELILRSMPDWAAVDALLGHVAPAAPSVAPAPAPAVVLPARSAVENDWFQGFDHPTTDRRGHVRSHTVRLQLPESRETTTTFCLAVRLKTRTPNLELAATLLLRTPHLEAMPAQVVGDGVALVDDPASLSNSTGTKRCLRMKVPAGPWDVGRGGAYLDFAVPIPAHRRTVENLLRPNSELKVSLELSVDGVTHSGSLKFERFSDDLPVIVVPHEDQTDLSEMKAAPLGVQPGYEALDHYVRQATKSFIVSAPRRFGKTTLLRYLEEVARENKESFAVRITLNRNDSPAKSLATVLGELRETVKDHFGAAVEFPLSREGQLDRGTFRGVRELLARKGIMNLVLLVDEAQCMVPRSDGGAWGTTLKNLIEGDLATRKPDLARVCLIMAGTPQLPRRLGSNCQAFMNVMGERTAFDESELASFVRRISDDRIESSAQARERLATTANNLYTLKDLLRETLVLAKANDRSFFLSGDVDAASERLVERDRNGTLDLWNYVAAELSHTDSWDPIDAYPVALALAAIQDPTVDGASWSEKALLWLDARLEECGIQASVTVERVTDGIQELVRLGILSADGSFRRPLLEQLLRRRIERNPFQHNLDQIALARLAADVIQWNPQAVPNNAGGQARVFLLDTEDARQAWRVCKLDTDNDRRRFVRTCAAIKVLRDVRTRLDGDKHLPRVRLAGFDLDDPTRGIIVYDWIEGEQLHLDWETANVAARLHVGLQIAMALAALHARGVIHRDVHPRNVIVDGDMNAVLIDFGMACLSSEAQMSKVSAHNFLAPELVDGTQATFASDLFALGRIIRGPNGSDIERGSQLARVVEQLTQVSPANRPSTSQAVTLLKQVAAERPFLAGLEAAQKKRDEVLEKTFDREWLFNALAPHTDAAAFRIAGLQRWSNVLAIQAAACLNGVFEAWVRDGSDPQARELASLNWQVGPSLAAVGGLVRDRPSLRRWSSEYVASVGALRNAGAHPAARGSLFDRARQHEKNRDPLQVYATSLKGTASLLDSAIGTGDVISRFTQMLVTGGAN